MKKYKSIIAIVLSLLASVYIVPYASAAEKKTTTYANLIVFVDFADTTHVHEGQTLAKCYATDPSDTLRFFNGTPQDQRGMKPYYERISYGQISVNNIMPQYDGTKITPLVLEAGTLSYTSGPLGSFDEYIIQDVLVWLKKQNLSAYNLDGNNDGFLDNLTLVLPYEYGNFHTNIRGHKSTWSGTDVVGNVRVGSYNVIPEQNFYFSLGESGLVIHEFMHTLGAPDLYPNSDPENKLPVSYWDMMAAASTFVQYPLAYTRSRYLGIFDIPEVMTDKDDYTIYAASSATYETRNNQAVILKTDYSDKEFFVIEYRIKNEKIGDYYGYERKIPGTGLVIYRVNTEVVTNITGEPYLIYIFRENNNINQSFYSAESGRGSFSGLTYLDGTNSGITINDISAAGGDTISFDITFKKPTEEWKSENGSWYYYDKNGNKVFGWQLINEKWYHFGEGGVMTTGWLFDNGKWYHMNKWGAMVTGWAQINGKWYYMNSNGAMLTDWQQINGKWYYFNTSGAMVTGWQKIGGKWYYFNNNGAMLTGWQSISGKWYYFNASGAMLTGWQSIGGKWYYFNSSGAMLTGTQRIDGKYYRFNSSGVWIA